MTQLAANRCPFCEKQGLPILPLRPAVARTDMEDLASPALDMPAPLATGLVDVGLPGNAAKYTARLLRPGYLYVFNEARGEWKAYLVTDLGFLYEFDVEDVTPPDADGIEFSCFRTGEEYIARCITIPDATSAGAVWLAFSDTAWTPAVLAEHRKQAYRSRHMTRIEVGQWVAGNTNQPHTASFDQLTQVVNEFAAMAPDDPHGGQVIGEVRVVGRQTGRLKEKQGLLAAIPATTAGIAFSHSHHEFVSHGDEAQGLLDWAARAAEKLGAPAMLATVGDPVGITAELAMLMACRLDEHLAAPEHERPLAVSAAINNIRRFIREDAENREFWKSEREARNVLDPGYMAVGDGAGGARAGMALAELLRPDLKRMRAESYESWKNPSPERVRRAREKAWAKYKAKHDHRRLAAWEDRWSAGVSELDRTTISPLADAHAQWMQSDALAERLHCSCDEADVQSGKGFADSLLFCIQNTQEYAPCNRLYTRWLQATQLDKRNLLLRALGYNQKEILEPLDTVLTGGLHPDALKGLPWDRLISGYGNATGALEDGGKNAVVRLVAAVGGPFADVAGTAVDELIGPGLVFLGLIAEAPVVVVDAYMSKAEAIAELTARAIALNPKVEQLELEDLNRAIDLQMRKAGIYGADVNARGHYRYLIMLDEEVVADFPGLTPQGTARRFAESAVLTEADRAELTKLRWRKLLPGAAGVGVIAGCLQVAALTKLADDVDSSMAHEANENRWRYRTAVVGFAGTLAETTGKWSQSAATTGSRYVVRLEQTLGRLLRVAGKALGVGAGAAMAVWDLRRAKEEYREGNGWVALGFVVTGGMSVFASVAFTGWAASLLGAGLATGIGIVLVIMVIVAAMLIEVFKDDKLQDWLERCYFGSFDPGDRYKDTSMEMKELQVALRG